MNVRATRDAANTFRHLNPRHLPWIVAGALALLTAVAYRGGLAGPLIFDDHPAIETNPTIHTLLGSLSPPTDGRAVTGRPIVNLSFALNYQLGGLSVRGYHLFNVAIHWCCSCLLFGLARRILASAPLRSRFGRDANALAATIAILWLLHPLQTESITFIVQRTESLVSLLYLLTLYCFARAAETTSSIYWQAFAVIACSLGMATKEIMVSAPLLVLLYDRAFVAGSFASAWRQRSKFYLGLAATWLVLVGLVATQHGVRSEASTFDPAASPWTYLLTQCRAIALYIKLSAWPHPLIVDYGTQLVHRATEVWPKALVLCAAFAATLAGVWRNTPWSFAAIWFFAILGPSSSVVPLPAQTIAEHRMYLPIAAIVFVAAGAFYLLCANRGRIAALLLGASLLALTVERNRDYRSEESIWRDTIAKLPDSWRAHFNLGWTLEARRHDPKSIPEYEAALKLKPDYVQARTALASVLLMAEQTPEAAAHAREALKLAPYNATAHCVLGLALIREGKLAEALRHLEIALQQNPSDEDALAAHGNFGIALFTLGRLPEAIDHFNAVLKLNPNDAQTHAWLANAYLLLNHLDDSRRHAETAIRLQPNYVEAHNTLGAVCLKIGQRAEAVRHFEDAVRLRPDYAEAHFNLASALLQIGEAAKAVEHLQATLRVQPSYPHAHDNLGLALIGAGRPAEAARAFEESLRVNPDDAVAREELAKLKATHAP